MTPEDLAAIHARAMGFPPPWSIEDFRRLLADPQTLLVTRPGGFLLGRVVLDEAEVLTLAVDPGARRQGIGRVCLLGYEAEAHRRGARRSLLDVAADNCAARALYASAGYATDGTRPGYYAAADGCRVDAILMSKAL